ncbi:MAG: hypothetical protein KA066_02340 [Candidatus Pacebacteria bacterium]|nr:hypothetical protein [Candidatus Paceibacterota bacterium]
MTYKNKLKSLLTPAEQKLFAKLSTPNKIQDYLDAMPNNVLHSHEHTMRSPRRVMRDRKAHCMEGAMLAVAALAYHGRPPILLGLEATAGDYDHIVALFKEGGRWGAISKTNYPVLRWRDPVYLNVRELVMSYFHEYFLDSGRKTLRRYSAPFNIQKYDPARWLTTEEDVDWLAEELGEAKHFPIAPPATIKKLRKASKIEVETTVTREWTRGGKKLF